jgi:uncharacterized membrane-anchored protein YitT (DUF2179 family)
MSSFKNSAKNILVLFFGINIPLFILGFLVAGEEQTGLSLLKLPLLYLSIPFFLWLIIHFFIKRKSENLSFLDFAWRSLSLIILTGLIYFAPLIGALVAEFTQSGRDLLASIFIT